MGSNSEIQLSVGKSRLFRVADFVGRIIVVTIVGFGCVYLGAFWVALCHHLAYASDWEERLSEIVIAMIYGSTTISLFLAALSAGQGAWRDFALRLFIAFSIFAAYFLVGITVLALPIMCARGFETVESRIAIIVSITLGIALGVALWRALTRRLGRYRN